MKTTQRSERVAEILKRELSRLLIQKTDDKRLSLLTINELRLSADLRLARIYVGSLDPEHAPETLLSALKKATGFFRHELSQRTTLRVVPKLTFFYDEFPEKAAHLSSMIDHLPIREDD